MGCVLMETIQLSPVSSGPRHLTGETLFHWLRGPAGGEGPACLWVTFLLATPH